MGQPAEQRRGPVTWRAVLLGGAAAAFVAGLAQFNDWAAANAQLVNSLLPTGLLAFFFVVMLAVVGPVSRFAPRYAPTRGELAVALAMGLVACAIPSNGLMRYLPGTLLNVWSRATLDSDAADYLTRLELPDWPFPAFESDDPAVRGNEPIVTQFLGRVPAGGEIPWRAWLRPAIGWGLLLVPLGTAVVCLMLIFRRQWVENERLAFPLAGVYLALIEPPRPGRWLGELFADRRFWVAFAAVFLLHGLRAMNAYAPRPFPLIPLEFDLTATWAGTLLGETDGRFFQQARLYPTVAALTLLIPTRLAFSLWFCFGLVQVERIWLGQQNLNLSQGATFDRTLGGLLLYGGLTVVIARRHLGAVLRQMVRPRRPGEPRGRYVPYGWAGWGFAVGFAGSIAWLVAAGSGVLMAVGIVGLLMLALLASAKVAAATGLPYAFLPAHLDRATELAAVDLTPASMMPGGRGVFWANVFNGVFAHDLRENLASFASHGLRTTDGAAGESFDVDRRQGWRFVTSVAGALVLAVVLAGTTALWVNYRHAATLDRAAVSPLDHFGSMNMGRYLVMNPALGFDRNERRVGAGATVGEAFDAPHSRPGQAAVGAAAVGASGYLSLRLAWWPIHPIGPLLAYSWAVGRSWPSLFVGWAIKLAVLRIGGARLFVACRPVVMGVVLGECAAAAFWIAVSLGRLWLGLDYHAYQVLTK